MTDNQVVNPRITVLSPEQIQTIHAGALKILENTGVRVDSPPVIQRFARVTGEGWITGDQVRIPRELVEQAIKSAPSVIDIYNRRGNLAFRLGEDRTRFGIGVTTLYYQEPRSDALLPFARQHMQQVTRLGENLPYYDVISTIGIVQDVPNRLSDLYGTLEMISNTVKPLVILVSNEDGFTSVLQLLENLQDNLATRPFVIPYFNPVTPLVMNKGTLDKMQVAIEGGLPFIFSNYSMAGMSTPITPAGTLVVLMAELLAGLTISQLIKEGAPVILGILPAYFDMKTMVNFYDPLSMLLNLACAEMMAYYRLPHCGTSGSGTGWGPDLLASETYWINHLTSCMSKVGLCPFVGDTLTSKAFSPVNVVYAHEIIAQSIRFSKGFPLDDNSLGLEDIHQAGLGGTFLASKLTRQHYRDAYYTSPVFPRWSLEKWQETQPKAIDLLREHTCQLLDNCKPPDDHDDLLARGEAFIAKIERM